MIHLNDVIVWARQYHLPIIRIGYDVDICIAPSWYIELDLTLGAAFSGGHIVATRKIGRDAGSGQFKPVKEAQKDKKGSVVETIKVPPKPPTPPKNGK